MKRLIVALWILVLLTLAQSFARADTLRLDWGEVTFTHPVGYRVYWRPVGADATAWQFIDTGGGITTMQLHYTQTDLAGDCERREYAIKAVGILPDGGRPESAAFSNIVPTMPEPIIASVQFNAGGVHRVMGDNFPEWVAVEVNGVPVTDGLNRVACQVVEFPATAGTPTSITVINQTGSLSPITAAWALPPPMAPANLTRTDSQ